MNVFESWKRTTEKRGDKAPKERQENVQPIVKE